MKTLILFLITNMILSAQWLSLNNGLPDSWESNSAIDAADANTAVVALYNYPATRIFLTTDAGDQWTEIPTPYEINNLHVNDIEIYDINNIWICTGETDPNRGRIYYTADLGVNWVKQYDNKETSTYFNYIEMFDELNGVAMGDPPFDENTKPPLFLRTFNGGITWEQMNHQHLLGSFSASRWQSVDFINTVNGYFVPSHTSAANNTIYSTTDSGVTWGEIYTSGHSNLTLLKFFDENIGYASGQSNDTTFYYKTINGGQYWEVATVTDSEEPVDVAYLHSDSEKLWKIDRHNLEYSETGGTAWHDFTPAESFTGVDIEFTADDAGWLLSRNTVYYTTITSPTVGLVETEGIPEEFSLNQNYPNPFNPATKISFSITERNNVKLSVYDIIGTEIAIVVNEELNSGSYEFQFDASKYSLSSGIYLYRIVTDKQSIVKKMSYLK